MLSEDVYINLMQMHSNLLDNKKLCAKGWPFEIDDNGASGKETI